MVSVPMTLGARSSCTEEKLEPKGYLVGMESWAWGASLQSDNTHRQPVARHFCYWCICRYTESCESGIDTECAIADWSGKNKQNYSASIASSLKTVISQTTSNQCLRSCR